MANGTYAININELDIDFPGVTGQETGSDFVIAQRYVCRLTGNRALCYLPSPNLTFAHYYENSELLCCARADDNFQGDKLCQRLTNKKSWYNGCGDNVCHCYMGSG